MTSLQSQDKPGQVLTSDYSSPRTYSTLQSDHGYCSDPSRPRPSKESFDVTFCDGLGMPSVKDLFFDAQRNYVERFVLGIDPRRHEITQNVNMIKSGSRPTSDRLLTSSGEG